MPDLFLILTFLIIIAYFLMIIAFRIGWSAKPQNNISKGSACPTASILIPCRNEQDHIQSLASALENQEYPLNQLEIIWIDDHSTDQTAALISGLVNRNPIHRLVSLTGETTGKKNALQAGMNIANGEVVLLTDADSRPQPGWISSMTTFMEASGSTLVAGPVILGPANRWHQKIQKLEFLSLVASSAGAAGIGIPFMIQGPNICVRAEDYHEAVKELENRYLSGDDMFLLQSMKRRNKRIRFNLNPEAMVESSPTPSLTSFLWQRQRWASKAKGYTDPVMISVTLLVFLANLAILAATVGACAGLIHWIIPAALFAIKTIADLALLIKAASFFESRPLLGWFLPVQLIYPVYIVFTGILAMAGRVRWKQS
jgi:cellulose synthase/poly-beta-1,6-N-acetylglucosamine synthase-like glycosyltransferase